MLGSPQAAADRGETSEGNDDARAAIATEPDGVAVSPDGASLYAVSVVDEAIVRFARGPGLSESGSTRVG